MMTTTDQFLLQQYDALRTEVDHTIEQARRLLFWAVAGTGLVWSWTFSHYGDAHSPLQLVQLCSPAVLTLFCWRYGRALDHVLCKLRKHLADLEEHFLQSGNRRLGYEHSGTRKKERRMFGTPSRLGRVTISIHLTLVLLNAIAAFYVWQQGFVKLCP